MPRGKARSGQFVIELYFPGGGSIKYRSTHDHTPQEWQEQATKYLDEAKGVVQTFGATAAIPTSVGEFQIMEKP
jgi:hypothetical protein